MSLHPRILPKCLLIEDSKFDQKRVLRVLSRAAPVQLDIADSIAHAHRFLAKQRYDMLIMDNALPDGWGIDYADFLRSVKRFASIPILMVSDHPTPFMFTKAKSARISRVLSKDEFLPQHINEALQLERIRRESKS